MFGLYVLIGGIVSPNTALFFINKKNRNKKMAVVSFIVIALLTIGLAYIVPEENLSSDEVTNEPITEQSSDNKSYIHGMTPTEICNALKKEGFTIKEQGDDDYGYLWNCENNLNQINHVVTVFSENKDSLSSVRVSYTTDNVDVPVGSTYDFTARLFSLVLKNYECDNLNSWLFDNYNNDKASISIGNTEINIVAPSIMVRMITIKSLPKK